MTRNKTLSWLLALALGPVMPMAGCDDGGDDDDDAADSGTSNAEDDDSDDSDSDDSDSDDSDSDSDDSDSDDSDDSDSDDSDDSDSDDSDSDSDDSAGSCDGGWYLGSVPFTGDSFIEACDANPPQLCLTGNYIVFDNDECFCLPECAAAGLSEGDDCTDDGSIQCTRIENDEGTSSGVFCVPPQWGLCGG